MTPTLTSLSGSAAFSGRAIALYLAFTFAFAWILWGYWVIAMPSGGVVISPAFLACAIIGGFAPSLAAMFVSWRDGRWPAVRELLASALRPVSGRYLLLAIGIVPLASFMAWLLEAAVAGVALRSPDTSLLAVALIWPIMAALGEEFGWRGYLTARLSRAWPLLPTALVVGLIWGVWHLPADFVGLKGYGGLFWAAFLINGPIVLTAHSIIISWLWRRTDRSTLTAIAYHWSITATAMVAPSATIEGAAGLLVAGIGATMMWLVAIALLILRWPDFSLPVSGSGTTGSSGEKTGLER